jgi:phosphoribosylamine---glycine ligase
VRGIVDFFIKRKDLRKIKIIGPDASGARLEGSKDFSKNFMRKYHIPTASSETFTNEILAEGLEHLKDHPLPIVLKADGLAAGKGVIIAESYAEAQNTLKEMLVDAKFGDASSKVVVEQFLTGIEVSVFVLSDGVNYKILPEAKSENAIRA